MAASDAGFASSGTPEAENCSEIRLLLSALVDNEASPEEAVRAKNHLLICSDCASHLAFLRLTGRVLSQAPEAYPSASLSARIAAATYERPTLADRVAGWLRPAPVRVVLGTAMAAGLALVLVIPRIGNEVAHNTPPVPETNVASPQISAKDTVPAEKSLAKTVKPAVPTPAAKSMAAAVKPDIQTGVLSALTMLAPKPPVTVAKTVAPPVRKLAPVRVASTLPADSNLAAMSREERSIRAALQSARTEPRIDRRSTPRSAIPTPLKNPVLASPVFPRSGYDRAAATEQVLKPRVTDTSTPALSVASAATPSLSPMMPENTAGKLADPGGTTAERIGARTPTASTAVSAVASEAQMPIRFRSGSRPPSNTAVLTYSGADQKGSGSLPAGGNYSLANNGSSRISITSAPVTGIN